MQEWYIYDKNGKKRKARAEEVPRPLKSGVNPEDGILIPKKRSDKNAKK